jgi:nucleoside-diphosphate-sugar epimerase
MNIVVTGAAGYIGSKLTRYLLWMGHNVTCFDNYFYGQESLCAEVFNHPRCTFIKEDVTLWSDTLIEAIRTADVIYPLAAFVGAPLCDEYPEKAVELNEKWMEKLIPHLVNQIVVYPNTNSGYGSTGDDICTEETPSNPLSLYASTKQNAENTLMKKYHRGVCFRLATVFGKSYRTRIDLLINNLVKTALSTGNIKVFDGHFRRNYIHIDDVVAALYWPISRIDDMKKKVYNLGNDSLNMTKLELVEKICDYTDATYDVVTDRTDPDKRDYLVSSKKLYKLGYIPMVDLETGVREMIDFYKTLKGEDVPKCRNY